MNSTRGDVCSKQAPQFWGKEPYQTFNRQMGFTFLIVHKKMTNCNILKIKIRTVK